MVPARILSRLDPAARARAQDIVFDALRPHAPVVQAADIGVWSKSDPQVWTAGNATRCCARWGSWIQDAFIRSPNAAHLLLRRVFPQRVMALVVLLVGQDGRTLLVNSVEMARSCRRFFGGRQALIDILEPFLVRYARRNGLSRVHVSARYEHLRPAHDLALAKHPVLPLRDRRMYTDVTRLQYVLWDAAGAKRQKLDA